VRSAADALDDPDLRRRGAVTDVALSDGSLVAAGRPIAWVPVTSGPQSAPALGQDTDAVLAGLGRDPRAARADGALG
jgi:crotonobetainyl-CoA:carnitine CoA-transferase CaiB-like acyl-CoA transferase